ncbi:glycerophosphodiester phosphodiesterase family protein [Chromatiaceae bacterium AAb-1]|nr:glycerophosphodiester phosphodiesterase family protein [Chromatiaceae bacterium AAb-1]
MNYQYSLLVFLLLVLTGCQQTNISPQAQLGPRPFYLMQLLQEGELKQKLQACQQGPFYRHDFSIAHRGAPLLFPEHTRESYLAAIQMGAGIMECDVAFTKDQQLVCRHAQCDLHQTTDILLRPELAAKCTVPFSPADATTGKAAEAMCCTSDITLAEFRSLCGKMEGQNPEATTAGEFVKGTPAWRSDLHAYCGTVMSHRDSIALFAAERLKMTPELKTPEVPMPFAGVYSQQQYAQQLVDEYKAAGISPQQVFLQSFDWQDILYWLEHEPEFGKQAVWLDGRDEDPAFSVNDPQSWQPSMTELKAAGLNIIAPPLWMLVTELNGKIVPSQYAIAAKAAGLEIIGWSLERSGPLHNGGGWYYQTIEQLTTNDSVVLELLHVLAQDIGVKGVFSDWPATTTFYANCML